MKNYTAGEFQVIVHDPYPISIEVEHRHGGKTEGITFNHLELPDLLHALGRAQAECARKLRYNKNDPTEAER